MIDKSKNYTGPWAAFFFLNLIGMFLLGIFVNWILPLPLAIIGVEGTSANITLKIIGFILSMPVSYFFFHLAVETYLIPKINKENA